MLIIAPAVTLSMGAQGGGNVANGLPVNVYVDGSYVGQAVTSNGGNGFVFTLPGLSVGTHSLTASFAGNAQYGPSTSAAASLHVVSSI